MIDLCAIRKLQTALKAFEDRLKEETGLSMNDAMCLCAITKGIREPGSLARELELSPSRLTRILDDLETRGFVDRRESEKSRRHTETRLTERGRELVARYRNAGIELPEELAFAKEMNESDH